MKNQINKMVTLEWLLPLLNQQLSQVSDSWKVSVEEPNHEQMAEGYHKVRGALIIVELPLLANLAAKLSLLAGIGGNADLDDRCYRIGRLAHQLLQFELTQYVQTGSYHTALISRADVELTTVLAQMDISTDCFIDSDYVSTDSAHDQDIVDFDIAVPIIDTISHLSDDQYQQLLLVWRQQVQQLLIENKNTPSILAVLEKASQYLWQTTNQDSEQRLWYLAELWFQDIVLNNTPLPEAYAPLLSRLEQIIEISGDSTDDNHSDQPPSEAISGLITDLYIELSGLANTSERNQFIRYGSKLGTVRSSGFLPRVMSKLEAVIFGLDNPSRVVDDLIRIEKQLNRRGWMTYASQAGQIRADIEHSLSGSTEFVHEQWQIERQLQELYSSIYNTEQGIVTKIGLPTSYSPISTATDNDQSFEDDSVKSIHSDTSLRELRIAIEEIKQSFSNYLQHQQIDLLPSSDDFTKINTAFNDVGLSSVCRVTNKIQSLFEDLVISDMKTLSWDITQALAESLTSIELLLDYLAQQIFDDALLDQADAYIDKAYELLNVRLQTPIEDQDAYLPTKKVMTDVLRYNDEGEIAPHTDDSSVSMVSSENIVADDISENDDDIDTNVNSASKPISDDVKPDNFDMDEEIREIFIEEANEVVADLEDFLPIWQEDKQNLTPLTEVRRGFHTLKGSGRMVGAFSISEMAWSIENLLNRLLDKTLPVSDEAVSLVIETINRLPLLIKDFESSKSPTFDPAITLLQSKNLLSGQPVNQGVNDPHARIASQTNDKLALNDAIENDVAKADSNDNMFESSDYIDENSSLLASDFVGMTLPKALEPFVEEAKQLAVDADDADPDIKEIFIEEANEVLEEIVPLFEKWRDTATDLNGLMDIRRGFHTLKGSGRMVGANYTGELAWSIENMLNRILDHTITVSEDIKQLIADVLESYPTLITIFENGSQEYPLTIPLWVACANAFSKQLGNEFKYSEIRNDGLGQRQESSLMEEESSVEIDDMLQKIYSVNEIISEAPTVTAPQSKEEQEFCEIFIDEAETLLDSITEFVNANQNQSSIEVSDEIVRAFHTLRGASGSNALTAISDVSATIEKSLAQLQKHDKSMTAQHLKAISQSVMLIEGYLNNFKQSVLEQNQSLEETQSHEDLATLQAMLQESNDTVAAADGKLSVTELLAVNVDGLLDAEWELSSALSSKDQAKVESYLQQQILQIESLAAQSTKSHKFVTILNALGDAYRYLSQHPLQAQNAEVQSTLLAGHAQLVSLFDALAGSMSLKVSQQVVERLLSISDNDTHEKSIDNELVNDGALIEEADTIIDIDKPNVQSRPASTLDIESIETDAELLEIFLEEAQELDQAIIQSFNDWRDDINNVNALKILQRHLHTIKGGARMAGIRSIGDLTHEAESVYEAFVTYKQVPTVQWLAIMQIVQDTLSLQITYLLENQRSFFATELTEQLQQLEKAETLPTHVNLIVPVPKGQNNREATSDQENTELNNANVSSVDTLERMIKESWTEGLPDFDILEVFLEEAEALVHNKVQLQAFLDNVSDIDSLQVLQRDLHTIKGGARMVSSNGIGDLADAMGTVYKSFVNRRRPVTKKVLELLVACHEWLIDAVYVLGQHINPPTPTLLIEALQQFSQDPDTLKQIPNESLQEQFSSILAAKQNLERAEDSISEMPPMGGNFAEQEQNVGNNEMIRISGGLIEHMINLSGESAINRARIDMGMSSLTNSIEEMGTTVQRLADQLRRMEIELEAQILSQIDDELMQDEDFDPLEMDQYSSLNQLSKSLTESASDLVDINNTLLEKTRDSENLLLQLSRTQTELQDGLMNSRMVPFTRLTPRLERVVRQTANELNKSVELNIINADDEMDRTILDRITSPLEHMLRNAVDHGIETTQERLKLGKPRNGHINLEVLREGSEFVINLTDDGRGIDVEAVRKKAIAQDLIDENDESLTDIDIMQYIFNAGLSTTQTVTQISGRGVGMDVVISEIRQLGGVVSVASEAGKGSHFTIRVPLTVAISDALIVRAADHHYAIPLVQIERVVRINPEKLHDYYQSNAPTLNIENADYRVRYLNEILSGSKLNELIVSTNSSLPVIIVKNPTGQNIAMQVDQIVGSRIEVVVKPLGRQFSHLVGISAATIMGDGSVMLILDPIALMRNTAASRDALQIAKAQAKKAESKTTILVVDDSVTVRKVTSRFLERQGLEVAIAKDGIDAIEILQETIPDLILLDIEMPRMDGFEVATQIRNNKRLQHIPIIMITSRTGEKHRKRAFEIGVNDYMGKPFQENELLDKIQNLLGDKVSLNYE